MLFVLPLGQKMTVKKKSILDRDHGHEEKARGVRDNAAERETEGSTCA